MAGSRRKLARFGRRNSFSMNCLQNFSQQLKQLRQTIANPQAG
jgi:hypothetical protein